MHFTRKYWILLAFAVLAGMWQFRSKSRLAAVSSTLPVSPSDVSTIREARNREEPFPGFAVDPTKGFRDWVWTNSFQGGEAELVVGRRLLEQRQALMRGWIRTNPEAALAASLSDAELARIPEGWLDLVEKRWDGRGDWIVGGFSPHVDAESDAAYPPVRRWVRRGEELIPATTFGSRLSDGSRKDVALTGIELDGWMAVDVRPYRILSELAGMGADVVCGISGAVKGDELSSAKGAEAVAELKAEGNISATSESEGVTGIAARFGDRDVWVCRPMHLEILEDSGLDMGRRARAKPAGTGPGSDDWTLGEKRLLVVPALFPGEEEVPGLRDSMESTLVMVDRYFRTNSGGRLSLKWTIAPSITLPDSHENYRLKDAPMSLYRDALKALESSGVDLDAYELELVQSRTVYTSFSGFGLIGTKGAIVQGFPSTAVAHELGHNLGLHHANSWKSAGPGIRGAGVAEEYGNPLDVMGRASDLLSPMSALNRFHLGWLSEDQIQTMRTNGIYKVWPMESGPGKVIALRTVPGDRPNRELWFETRATGRSGVADGGIWVMGRPLGSGFFGSLIYDATPGTHLVSGLDLLDGAIRWGNPVDDLESGARFLGLGLDVDGAERIQVWIKPDRRPIPVAPVWKSGPTNVVVGEEARFEVGHPSGNPAGWHFFWESLTGVAGGSSNVAVVGFPTAGWQSVRCTVTDSEGRSGVLERWVSVGQPRFRFSVLGKVTCRGGPVVGAWVTSSKGSRSVTDESGRYELVVPTRGEMELQLTHPVFSPAKKKVQLTLEKPSEVLDWELQRDASPTLEWMEPRDEEWFLAEDAIQVSTRAIPDVWSFIVRSELVVDGEPVLEVAGPILRTNLTALSPGDHRLEVWVVDSLGGRSGGFSRGIRVIPSRMTNDAFANPGIRLEEWDEFGTLSGSGIETGEPDGGKGSLWWEWRPIVAGAYRPKVEWGPGAVGGSLEIWRGDSLLNLERVTSESVMYFGGGEVSKLRLSGEPNPTNHFRLTWTKEPPPQNDRLDQPEVIRRLTGNWSGSNAAATESEEDPWLADERATGSLWYSFNWPTTAQPLAMDLRATVDGEPALLAWRMESERPGGFRTATGRVKSVLQVDGTFRPIRVTVGVAGAAGRRGVVRLDVRTGNVVVNDSRLSPLSIGSIQGVSFDGDHRLSVQDGSEPTVRHGGEGLALWYSWTAIDPGLWVVEKVMGPEQLIFYVPDGVGGTQVVGTNQVKIRLAANLQIRMAVDQGPGDPGTFRVRMYREAENFRWSQAEVVNGDRFKTVGAVPPKLADGEPERKWVGPMAQWWRWTPSHSGSVTFQSLWQNRRGRFWVFEGDDPLEWKPLEKQRWVEDLLLERFRVRVESNRVYAVAIEQLTEEAGIGVWDRVTWSPTPSNDDMAQAIDVSGEAWESKGDSSGATAEDGTDLPSGVWWRWKAPRGGTVGISVRNSLLHQAEVSIQVRHESDETGVMRQAGYGPQLVRKPVVAGEVYLIGVQTSVPAWAGKDSTGDSFEISASLGMANDDRSMALEIQSDEAVRARLTTVNWDPKEPFLGNGNGLAWWKWVAPTSGVGRVEARTRGSLPAFILAIQDARVLMAAVNSRPSDSGTQPAARAVATFPAESGKTYWVGISPNFAGTHADLEMKLDMVPREANDQRAGATALGLDESAVPLGGAGATGEESEQVFPEFSGAALPGRWWKWRADQPALASFRVSGLGKSPSGVFVFERGVQFPIPPHLVVRRDGRDEDPLRPGHHLYWAEVSFQSVAGLEYEFLLSMGAEVEVLGAAVQLVTAKKPSNDSFDHPKDLDADGADLPDDLVFATVEPDEECQSFGVRCGSVWYRWKAPVSGRFALTDSSGLVQFDVYEGERQDALWRVGTGRPVIWHAVGGRTYRIRLTPSFAGIPTGKLFVIGGGELSNDLIENSVWMGGDNWSVTGDMISATAGPDERQGWWLGNGFGYPSYGYDDASVHKSVWYRWTADADSVATLSLLTPIGDMRIAVWARNPSGSRDRVPVLVFSTTGNSQPTEGVQYRFAAEMGRTYDVAVQQVASHSFAGPFRLKMKVHLQPPQDSLEDAAPIREGETEVFGDARHSSVGVEMLAPTIQTPLGTIWWKWTAPSNAWYSLRMHGASAAGGLQVFPRAVDRDRPADLPSISLLKFAISDEPTAEISVSAGATYWFRYGAFNADEESVVRFSWRPTGSTSPSNDDFAAAATWPADLAEVSGEVSNASVQPQEPVFDRASLWWKWTAPSSGVRELRLFGDQISGSLMSLSVYEGTNWPPAAALALRREFESAMVRFRAVEGREYRIRAGANGTSEGSLARLSMVSTTLVPGDDFNTAIPWKGSSNFLNLDIHECSREADEPVFSDQVTRWITWQAPDDGVANLQMGMPGVPGHGECCAAAFAGDSPESLRSLGFGLFPVRKGESVKIMVYANPNLWKSLPVLLQWAPAPAGDEFSAPLVLHSGPEPISGVVGHATVEPGENLQSRWGASTFVAGYRTLWLQWTAPEDMAARLEFVLVETQPPWLRIVTGLVLGASVTNPVVWISPNNLSASPGLIPPLDFDAVAGRTYRFAVLVSDLPEWSDQSPDWMPFTATVKSRKVPLNDSVERASVIPAVPAGIPVDHTDGSVAPGEPWISLPQVFTSTLWWKWTAQEDTWMEARITNGFVRVFRADTWWRHLGALPTRTQNMPTDPDSFYTPATVRRWLAAKGVEYLIMVANRNGFPTPTQRDFLTMTPLEMAPNDMIAEAVPWVGISGTASISGLVRTSQARENLIGSDPILEEPNESGEIDGDQWWRWTAPDDGSLKLRFGAVLDERLSTGFVLYPRISIQDDPRLGVPNGVRSLFPVFPVQTFHHPVVRGRTYYVSLTANSKRYLNQFLEWEWVPTFQGFGAGLRFRGANSGRVVASQFAGKPALRASTLDNTGLETDIRGPGILEFACSVENQFSGAQISAALDRLPIAPGAEAPPPGWIWTSSTGRGSTNIAVSTRKIRVPIGDGWHRLTLNVSGPIESGVYFSDFRFSPDLNGANLFAEWRSSDDGKLEISVASQTTKSHRLLRSTDLVNWTALADPGESINGRWRWHLPRMDAGAGEFFRIEEY